jgi:hypothetical protein
VQGGYFNIFLGKNQGKSMLVADRRSKSKSKNKKVKMQSKEQK